MTDTRIALRAVQKPGQGVPAYLRWVNRPLGGRVAIAAAKMNATPNTLTAISAAASAAGLIALIVLADPWAGPVAAALLLLGYIFDSADGQLARLQGRGGPAGEWLDHVVDGIRAPLVHIALAIHLVRAGSAEWLVVMAVVFSALVSAWFLSQLLAEKLAGKGGSHAAPGRGILESFVKQPQDPSTTYAVVAVIGAPVLFAVAYGALFGWQAVMFVLSLRRKYRQLAAR